MSGGEFLDTNVLVYAHNAGAGSKHETARALVSRLFHERRGRLSIQVLAEFYSAATRKGPLSSEQAEAALADYRDWAIHSPTHSDLLDASRLGRRYRISWWDAMIVNSAIALGATTLWTEDLNHGQEYGSVTVRNPFAG